MLLHTKSVCATPALELHLGSPQMNLVLPRNTHQPLIDQMDTISMTTMMELLSRRTNPIAIGVARVSVDLRQYALATSCTRRPALRIGNSDPKSKTLVSPRKSNPSTKTSRLCRLHIEGPQPLRHRHNRPRPQNPSDAWFR